MSSLPDEPMWTWPFAPRRRMVTLRVQDQDVRFPPELKALPRETEADWMRLFWASVLDADPSRSVHGTNCRRSGRFPCPCGMTRTPPCSPC